MLIESPTLLITRPAARPVPPLRVVPGGPAPGALRGEAARAIRAAEEAGHRSRRWHGDTPPTVLEDLDRVRSQVREALGDGQVTDTPGVELLAALDAARHALAVEAVERRELVRERIGASVRRLRATSALEALAARAPGEVCAALGVSRVLLSQVQGSRWLPESVGVAPGVAWSEVESGLDGLVIPLSHTVLEADVVRRRVSLLVADVAGEPRVARQIAQRSRATSYVVAPIVSGGHVIGLLHADRLGQELPVSDADRVGLTVFGAELGVLHERAVLAGALQRQRRRLRRDLLDLADELDASSRSPIDLVGDDVPAEAGVSGRTTASRLGTLLTPREREVLELMASGATNSMIAAELVIAEGTIKSHAKQIFRKLRVSSRTAAVAKYLQLETGLR